MTDLKQYFLDNARLSRRSLAEFLCLERAELNALAEELDVGDRLTLEEAQELVLAAEDGDTDDDDDDESDE